MEHPRQLTASSPGERLDLFIVQQMPELTRSFVQKLIEDGFVTLNARPAKASTKLKAGDAISVTVPPPAPCDIEPEDIPLHIVYEDDDLLVVDKPAGMTAPRHPAHGSRPRTRWSTPCFLICPFCPTAAAPPAPALCTGWTRIHRALL